MDENEQFTRWWTKTQPLVSSFIAASVPDFQDAEDILQNVAVVCLRKFRSYDPSTSFLRWATTIAQFEIHSWQRKYARSSRSFLAFRSDLLNELTEVYDELAPELEARTRALRECLDKLDDREADVVRLRYEEALKTEQVAAHLGVSGPNVRVILTRIRSILRDCIERKLNANGATT